jgi:hypothetical protein
MKTFNFRSVARAYTAHLADPGLWDVTGFLGLSLLEGMQVYWRVRLPVGRYFSVQQTGPCGMPDSPLDERHDEEAGNAFLHIARNLSARIQWRIFLLGLEFENSMTASSLQYRML